MFDLMIKEKKARVSIENSENEEVRIRSKEKIRNIQH